METIEQVEDYFQQKLNCSIKFLIGGTVDIASFDNSVETAIFLGVGDDGYEGICVFCREKDSVEVYGVHPSRVIKLNV